MAQAQYWTAFPCVEIDTSFYNLPRLETAARWRAAAPADFTFLLKAWQVITHRADSPTYERTRLDARDREHCGDFGFNPTVRWAWDQTFAVAQELRAALVLFQCPVGFRPTTENVARLKRFFEKAKRGKLTFGWEPRGAWAPELIAQLCEELDLIHVVDPLEGEPAKLGRLRYFRLRGHQRRYTGEELQRLRALCAGRTPGFCLFSNTAMAADARQFQQLLRSQT